MAWSWIILAAPVVGRPPKWWRERYVWVARYEGRWSRHVNEVLVTSCSAKQAKLEKLLVDHAYIYVHVYIVLYFVDGPVEVGKRGCFWSLEVGGQHTEALAKSGATTSFQWLPEIFPLFSESLKPHWTETAFDFFYRTSLTRSWEYQSSRNQRIFLYLILKFWSYQIRLSVSSQKVVFCTLYDSYAPVSVPLVFHFCGEIWLKICVFTTEAFLQVSAIWWSCGFRVPAMPDRGVANRGIFSYRCHFGYLVGWTMGTTWNHSLRSYKAWKS